MKPYYEQDGITIYNGNCLDVMPSLAPVDVIITDPPYGVGKADWDVDFPVEWIGLGFNLAQKILCMSGNSAIIKAGCAFGDRYKDVIVMNAVNGMTRSVVGFGKWFPVIVAGDWRFEGRPNLIRFVVDGVRDVAHPCPKPLNAMLPLLHHYTKENETILDCFAGSGTTLLAAKRLGRKAIGIEVNAEYCNEAIARLSQTELFGIASAKNAEAGSTTANTGSMQCHQESLDF